MNYEAFLTELERVQDLPAAEQKQFFEKCLKEEQDISAVRVHASYCYGALFFWEGDFRRAIDITEPIVMEYRCLPFSEVLLGGFNLLGTAMHCEKEFIEARFVYELALKAAQEHQVRGLYAREYNNIASIYVMEEDYAAALRYLALAEQALPFSTVPMGAYIYLNKAVSLRKLERLPEAREAFETAVSRYNAREALPDDTLLCGVSLYYALGEQQKYAQIKQLALDRLKQMHASEIIETCENLLECGMDAGDEALVAEVFRTMERYMQDHPEDIKVGVSMADLKYRYAEKKADREAMLEALQLGKSYQSRLITRTEYDRVRTMEKNIQITSELQGAIESRERASKAKTQFLSAMSHDIRTPLNGIIGLLKVDEAYPEDEQLIQSNRGKMQVAANHLLSLINDVLDMSKIEDGGVILAHEVVDFPELTEELMSILGETAKESGVEFAFTDRVPKPAPCVYGSPKHLRQIFLNIYSNCIKYNRVGGSVSTLVELTERQEGRCTYRWTITDTGIGMSEAFLGRIFEPFVQEKNDARSTYNGTGLGMSIVKGLVDQMGGTITVSSQVGIGSSFVVTIPFEIAPAPQIGREEPKEEGCIQGRKLLLVEDNALNAEIAQMLLTSKGAEVTLAENGQQAVDLFAKAKPGTFDAILMDVRMPVMDGLTAARTIRGLNRPDAAAIPILAMTANAFEEDARACMEAGMNAHLSKPLDMDKVVAAIAQACAK